MTGDISVEGGHVLMSVNPADYSRVHVYNQFY